MYQGRFWILTIPHHLFAPYLPQECSHIRGQLEQGNNTDYLHWQVVCATKKKTTLNGIKKIFGTQIHAELTKGPAANSYVLKDDTAISNTQFTLGELVVNRSQSADWDLVRSSAKSGDFENIPSDIYIRHYTSLKKIFVDHVRPVAQEKEVFVFWGRTGTGKSKRAWEEASLDAYPKSPTSIWWCGYNGHANVVIDEFRGQINISHMLRWLDRYPTLVEIKGSSVVLKAQKIWITSNIPPEEWYPELDEETKLALRRRFTQVIHFN